jgi:hypothetical protein
MACSSQSPKVLLVRLQEWLLARFDDDPDIAAPIQFYRRSHPFWWGGLALLEDMLDRVLGLAACGQDERPRAI